MLLEIKTWFVEASCCEWEREVLWLLLCTNKEIPKTLLPSNLGWPQLPAPPFLVPVSRLSFRNLCPSSQSPLVAAPALLARAPLQGSAGLSDHPLGEQVPALHLCQPDALIDFSGLQEKVLQTPRLDFSNVWRTTSLAGVSSSYY